jgi:hypothetical protein
VLYAPLLTPLHTPPLMLYDPQVYLDNRKSAAERGLEAPIRTATLMLARGVKTVVTTTMATTAAANTSFVQVRRDSCSAVCWDPDVCACTRGLEGALHLAMPPCDACSFAQSC